MNEKYFKKSCENICKSQTVILTFVLSLTNNIVSLLKIQVMKFNGQFDTIQEAVADTLNSKIPGAFNGFVPVVVSTIYTRNRANVGIQFWKPEWIFSGATRLNTDGTISKFIQQA